VRKTSTGELYAMKEINKNTDKRIVRTEVEIAKKVSKSSFFPKFYSVIEAVNMMLKLFRKCQHL